ncbi:MAG: phage tail protein [Pseudomonadota bacterium]
MNANGSLYHMLLGEADWGTCTVENVEGSAPLHQIWNSPLTVEERQFVPEWRPDLSSISIARLPQDLPPTRGETRFGLDDRRGAAADRHGNIYSVTNDRTGVEVQAAGTRYVTVFWPDPRGKPEPASTLFADSQPTQATRVITDLTVIEGDYLIALLENGDLLRFDLVGGGDPEIIRISEPADLVTTVIAPNLGGGAFLLNGNSGQLYRTTGDLSLCTEEPGEPTPSLFQPDDGAVSTDKPSAVPWSIDTSAVTDPVAMIQLDDRHLVILDHRGGARASLFLVELEARTVTDLLECSFGAIGMIMLPPDEDDDSGVRTALFWDAIGNQAYGVAFEPAGGTWEAGEDPELRPLRRFGGRGLVVAGDMAHYDSNEPMRWVGIGIKHRCQFAEQVTFTTPVYDSDIYQCLWDRIRLDGRIPAGCTIAIEARTFDDETLFGIDQEAGWAEQPAPYANGDLAELPKLSLVRNAKIEESPIKCWDVLLQNIVGRFVQFRVTLSGDGRQSPAISAMRMWYPRYSYARNFLPQVYSEDPIAGDFTDRFLASNEGVNTSLEDRIAAVRVLFDPRTVPAETLDWLADWFDVALDPSWDERRRRLFITHAVEFFGWRGTLPGLQLALSLAFDKAIVPEDFALPAPPAKGTTSVRIVEHFRTRKSARQFSALAGTGTGIHALIDADRLWHPSEGRSGLVERWAWARGLDKAPAEERIAPFSLIASDHSNPSDWAGFMQKQVGFAPTVGAQERSRWEDYLSAIGEDPQAFPIPVSGGEANDERWQNFIAVPEPNRGLWRDLLVKRYGSIEQLNIAWSSDWLAFEDIPLPHRAPDRNGPTRDWLDFEGALAPIHASAHRFSVLIPRLSTAFDPEVEQQALKLAQRIIELEKPAHTIFDVRLFWAMNRVGEARLGRDTEIGEGSRAPQLIPSSILGRSSIGASFAGGAQDASGGRELLAC